MKVSSLQDNPSILAVEDHPLFSEALQVLLATSGYSQVDFCTSVDEARQQVQAVEYALCLLDLNLDGSIGASLIQEFHAIRPAMRILVVSMYNDVSLVDTVLRKGAHGYLCKECPPDEYIPAIQQVLTGKEYISSDLRARLKKFRSANSAQANASDDNLTLREMSVLELLGRGATVKAIAAQLNISPKTVESHCASIKRKRGLASMNELIRHAVRVDFR